MNDIVKLITEYGVLIVIAGAFIYHVITSEKRHAAETKEFTEISASFANVIANHINEEQTAMRELTKAIERLCIYMELPNQDYKR